MPEREYDDNPYPDPNRNTTQPGGPMPPTPYAPPPAAAPNPARDKALADWRTKYMNLGLEDAFRQGYRDFLGRDADPDGLESMYGNPGGLGGVLETLYDSEEGQAYRSRSQATTPAAGGTGGTSAASAGRNNFANVQGFDQGNWDSANTLKYEAGRILSRYPTTSAGIQQALQDPDWLANPRLAKATFDGKDKINFQGALSEDGGVPVFDVDVLEALANGVSDRPWQWLDQAYMDSPSGGGGGGTGGGRTGGTSSDDLLRAVMDMISGGDFGGGQSNVLDQIMRELQAQAQGRNSPMAQQAMLQQLQRR